MKTNPLIFILAFLLFTCNSSKETSYKSTVDDSNITNTEQTNAIEVAVARQKQINGKLSSDNSAAVGIWEMTVETPRGTKNNTLTITESNGKLTGKTDNDSFEITQNGNTLNWSSTNKTPMGSMEVNSTAELVGDTMRGNSEVKSGMMSGRNLRFTARRK